MKYVVSLIGKIIKYSAIIVAFIEGLKVVYDLLNKLNFGGSEPLKEIEPVKPVENDK